MVYTQVLLFTFVLFGAASAGVINTNTAYEYSYGVNDAVTGDRKIQAESRDGGVVRGSYAFVQPDGILRTVNYVVDPFSGFQAQVLNNGIDVTNKATPVVPIVAASPAAIPSSPFQVASGPAPISFIRSSLNGQITSRGWGLKGENVLG